MPEKQTSNETVILKDLPTGFSKTPRPVKEPESAGKAGPKSPGPHVRIVDLSGARGGANGRDTHFLLRPQDGSKPVDLRRSVTRIGRNRDNHVVVEGDLVSRYHAEIRREGGDLVLEDLRSLNGVCVNGVRITAHTRLRPGDTIRIGTLDLALESADNSRDGPRKDS